CARGLLRPLTVNSREQSARLCIEAAARPWDCPKCERRPATLSATDQPVCPAECRVMRPLRRRAKSEANPQPGGKAKESPREEAQRSVSSARKRPQRRMWAGGHAEPRKSRSVPRGARCRRAGSSNVHTQQPEAEILSCNRCSSSSAQREK